MLVKIHESHHLLQVVTIVCSIRTAAAVAVAAVPPGMARETVARTELEADRATNRPEGLRPRTIGGIKREGKTR